MKGSDKTRNWTNRRKFLQAAGAAGLAGFAGCSDRVSASDDGGLSYWTLFSGGDGAVMESMVNSINESTDLNVNRQRVPPDEYYNRLYTALAAGEVPDVAILHSERLQEYKDYVVPMTDRIDTSIYTDAIMDKVLLDGELLGVPIDAHPYGLWWNKDVFEEAGLDPEAPPDTPEKLQNVCQTITENTDYIGGQIHGDSILAAMFHMFVRSMGSPLLTEDNEPGFDNEDGVAVARYLDEIINERGWVPQDGTAGWEAWNNGEAGFIIDGTWHLSVVRDTDFDFGVTAPAVMPDAEKHMTNTSSHTLIIPYDESRSDARREKAIKFIRELTQNYAIQWGTGAGHLPASKAALESDELRNSDAWSQSVQTFYEMSQNDQFAYEPRTDSNTEYLEEIWQRIQSVRLNDVTPETGVKQAANGVRGVFD
ncbi:extracellular solute-binding protein [Halopelagius longus]|uniref:Carbohydrate ABC transporter substrate-binding protein, CUT1 family n=1 Tax=Halopelagius longus TaxID=1236180 RepID=A0A1H1FM85_9EURY|nr:extracellular solute-binding protein [Halopelagius longus]RDI70214.1 extracellular solute-binding protein [Halopelagius longus]SDR02142.1 carbohydrate ABC transporter substrate-binding protein, CUT1 family [Halopelagius longus]